MVFPVKHFFSKHKFILETLIIQKKIRSIMRWNNHMKNFFFSYSFAKNPWALTFHWCWCILKKRDMIPAGYVRRRKKIGACSVLAFHFTYILSFLEASLCALFFGTIQVKLPPKVELVYMHLLTGTIRCSTDPINGITTHPMAPILRWVRKIL